MNSLEIITNSKNLPEAVKGFTHFMGWSTKVSVQGIKSNFSVVKNDLIITGDEEDENIDIEKILERIRKNNPFKPIVIISTNPSAKLENNCFKHKPVFFCSWPFNSKNFIDQLIAEKDAYEGSKSAGTKLDKVYALLDAGKPAEAKNTLGEIASLISSSKKHTLLAKCFLLGGKAEIAEREAHKACSYDRDNIESCEILARAKALKGDYAEAIATLNKNEKLINNNLECTLLHADLNFAVGELIESKKYYIKATAIDPKSADAKKGKYILGIIDGSINSVKSSEKDKTKKTIELAKVCNSKVVALVRAKQFDLAEKLYQNTIKIIPDKRLEYKLWMNLGLCMKKAKKYEKAKEASK
ncbi:MAG: tetratricopeptide repeat protein [Oligoflexales bacterium]